MLNVNDNQLSEAFEEEISTEGTCSSIKNAVRGNLTFHNGSLKITDKTNFKIDELVLNLDNELSDSESEKNSFIESMAEEVEEEEDVSTIGSNDIVDEGGNLTFHNRSLKITDKTNFKIDELVLNLDNELSDSESEKNSFIESMAEEVEEEEDVSTIGSNDIVDEGEAINTTESELSTNESYEENSFIDDEEYQLLSGNEFDLSIDNSKKRKRIIQLSSGSDDAIIQIKKKAKVLKKRKKSRIIRYPDSSDEESLEQNELNYSTDKVNGNFKIEESKKCESGVISNRIERTSEELNSSTDKISCNKENQNKKIIILENIKVEGICKKDLSTFIRNAINGSKQNSDSSPDTLTKVEELSDKSQTDADSKMHNILGNELKVELHKNKKRRKKTKIKKAVQKEQYNFTGNNKKKVLDQSKLNNDRNIIRDALKQSSKCPVINNVDEDWEVFNIPIKPSKKSNMKCDIGESTNVQSKTIQQKKKVKSFKDMMLYDKTRIRRMETHQLLRKKM